MILIFTMCLSLFPAAAFAVTSSVTLDVNQAPKVEVALSLGNTMVDVSTFETDLSSALASRGIDPSDVNIAAVESQNSNTSNAFDWWTYDHSTTASIIPNDYIELTGDSNSNAYNTLNNHIVTTNSGATMDFYGYGRSGYKDFNFLPNTQSTKKVVEFTIAEMSAYDALDGMGFLINSSITGTYGSTADPQVINGYLLFFQYNSSGKGTSIKLFKLNGVDTKYLHQNSSGLTFDAGNIANASLLATSSYSSLAYKKIKVEINPTAMKLWFVANADSSIFTSELTDSNIVTWSNGSTSYPLTPGYDNGVFRGGFGPMTSYRSHGCSRLTHFQLSNLTMTMDYVRSLTEIIREPEWNENYNSFLVNLNESPIEDFSKDYTTAEIINRLKDDDITYIGWCGDNNVVASQIFLDQLGGGTLVSVDAAATSTYPEQINAIADGIVDAIAAKKSPYPNTFLTTDQFTLTSSADTPLDNNQWSVGYSASDYGVNETIHAYGDLATASFEAPGYYQIYYGGNTSVSISQIRIHEVAVASFTLTASTSGGILVTNQSYDPEISSNPSTATGSIADGIATSIFEYMDLGNPVPTWTTLAPTSLAENKLWLVRLTVTDTDGATTSSVQQVSLGDTATVAVPYNSFVLSGDTFVKGYDASVSLVDQSYSLNGTDLVTATYLVKDSDNNIKSSFALSGGGTKTIDVSAYSAGSYTIAMTAIASDGDNQSEESPSVARSFRIVNGYIVSYDPAGGFGEPSNQMKIENEDLLLARTAPIKNGYIFKYWTDSSNTIYQPDTTYTLNAQLALTAQWKVIPTLIVDNKSAIYNGSTINIMQALVMGATSEGVVFTYYSDENCTISASPINGGIYYVKASISETEAHSAASSNVATLTIVPAEIAITVSDKTSSYTGSPIGIDEGLVSGLSRELITTPITNTYYTDISCTTVTTAGNSGASYNGGAPVYAGTYYAKATVTASENYHSATTEAPATLVISSTIGGSLSIGENLTKSYGDQSFMLSSTGGSGTGDVSFASSNPLVASVTADGYVTINAVGSATITAIKASDGNYQAQTVTTSITVNKKPVTYTMTDLNKSYTGQAQYVSVIPDEATLVEGKDYTVTYKQLDENISDPTEKGSYAIEVLTINNNYTGSATGTLNISSTGQSELQITGLPATDIQYDDAFALTANGGSGDGLATWEVTAGSEFATVDPTSGAVSITGVGTVTITATKAADGSYDSQTASVTFIATPKIITVTATAVDRDYVVGSKLVVVSLATGIDGVTASANSAFVATANAGADQIVTIEGVSINSVNYKAESTTIYTTVTIRSIDDTALTISGAPFVRSYGDSSFELLSSGGEGTGSVTFASSNPLVASVTADGYVTINAVGSATITATKASDGNYQAQTASTSITVNKKSVIYTMTNLNKVYSGQAQYASVIPDVASLIEGKDYTVTYKQLGVIISAPTEKGSYDIEVLTINDNYTGSVTGMLNISSTGQSELQITGLPATDIQYGDAFALTANGGSGDGLATWALTAGSEFATVDPTSGAVSITGVGTVTITATKAAEGSYDSQTASVTFIATPKMVPVTARAVDRDYVAGNTTVVVSLDTGIEGVTASANSAFVATASAGVEKTVTVEGVTIDSLNYKAESTTIYTTVTIHSIDDTALTISGAPFVRSYGDSSFELLSSGGEGTGSVTFASSNPLVASVTADGYVTINAVGSTTITASKASDGNYQAQTVTTSITVNKRSVTYSLENLNKVYSGQAQYASVIPKEEPSLVEGKDYTVTYKLDDQAISDPTEKGSYAVEVLTLNSNYTGSATGTLNISSTGQSELQITGLPATDIKYGDAFALAANGGSGDGLASWEVTAGSDFATVDPTSGAVLITGVGSVTITATKAADGSYDSQIASVTFITMPKIIAVTARAIDRDYVAGNTTVVVNLDTGIEGVTASAGSAQVATASAGLEKTVTVEGVTIDSLNYKAESTRIYTTVTIHSIDDAALNINGAPSVITYGDSSFGLLSSGGDGTGSVSFASSNPLVASVTADGYVTINAVGSTTITASKASDGNYQVQTASMNITVNKKPVIYLVNSTNKIYTGQAQYASVIPIEEPSLVEGKDYTVTYKLDDQAISDPTEKGSYAIEVLTINSNYTGQARGTLNISSTGQSELQITGLPARDILYDDRFALTANGGSGDGLATWEVIAGGEFATVNSTSGSVSITGVGTVTITATKAAEGSFNSQTAAVTFTSAPRVIEVTATAVDRDYVEGSKIVDFSLEPAVEGVTADAISATVLTANAGIDKKVTIIGVSLSDPNYQPESTTIYSTATISPIEDTELIIDGVPSSILYGDRSFKLTASSTGTGDMIWSSSNSQVVQVSSGTGAVTIVGAGQAIITADRVSDGNYNSVSNAVDIIVEQKEVTYSIVNNTKSYNGAVQVATIVPNVSSLEEGLDYIVTYRQGGVTIADPTEAGVYDIDIETISNNYFDTYNGAMMTIQAVDQTYTLEIGGLPNYMEYEDTFALYANGGNGNGDVVWEVVSGSEFASVKGSNGLVTITGVGTVTVTATKNADINYNEQIQTVTFNTHKKEINMAISGTEKTYNGEVQSVAIEGTATVNNELDEILEVSYEMQSDDTQLQFRNVGTYNVGVRVAEAYEDLYIIEGNTKAVANIEKADLTIRVDDQTKTYGDRNPEFTLSYTVLGSDESVNLPRVICQADERSDVGNYEMIILYDGGHGNDNYNITLIDGILTVIQREVSISWQKDTYYMYDSNEQSVKAELGNIANGDAIQFSYTGDTATNVGDYSSEITSIVGTNSHNYQLPERKLSKSWSINKVRLIVQVDDKEIEYGDAAPRYTLSYDGLKGSEDQSALEGNLLLSCDYTQGDDKGLFDITTSGTLESENYEIFIREGRLRVNPLAVKVIASGTTSRITISLLPVVSGLTLDNFILKQGSKTIEPSSATEYLNGAKYRVNASLSSKIAYSIGIDNGMNYDFSTSNFTVSSPSFSGGGAFPSITAMSNTISITETSSTILENAEMIEVSADMTKAFDSSVEVRISDNGESSDAVFGLIDASSKAYPFDISLYEKNTNEKVQPNEGYKVTITMPLPQALWELRNSVSVVYVADGQVITLPSTIVLKEGVWCIAFEAEHFSPYALVVNSQWENQFDDVSESDWFYEAVQYVKRNGIMDGTSETTFEPNQDTTRGMIVTILYRLEGEPSIETTSTFKDVASGTWYHDAVVWGEGNGVITGYDADAFGPTDSITREQLAAILHRYANFKGYDVTKASDLSMYTDMNDISTYAIKSMNWAVAEGFISGTTLTSLTPGLVATRARVARTLMRFMQWIAE